MKPQPQRILKFLKKHHLLSLATVNQESLWCCSCFYVYLPEHNIFVVTSDDKTKHIQNLNFNNNVAGTIALETKIIGKIRGIQFSGSMERLEGEELKMAEKAYLKRFPVARLMNTTLWKISVEILKMTDNRMGFGKKLVWEP